MKSFLSGRPQHDQSSLHPETPLSGGLINLAKHKGHSGHGAATAGPTVECVKQGDKVTRLIITCACGERIEVDCLYPTGG